MSFDEGREGANDDGFFHGGWGGEEGKPTTSRALPPASGDDLNKREMVNDESQNASVSLEALLRNADELKNKGNVEFHKGRALSKHTAGRTLLSDACLLYAEGIQALAKVDACLSERVEERRKYNDSADACQESANVVPSRADALRSALYLNLAAVNLLLCEWTPAMACCTRVIETVCKDVIATAEKAAIPLPAGPLYFAREDHGELLKGVAAKALYRRAAARVGIGGDEELVAARNDLTLTLTLKPGDGQVRRELAKVEKLIANSQAKEQLHRETEEGRRRREQENRAASALEAFSELKDTAETTATTSTSIVAGADRKSYSPPHPRRQLEHSDNGTIVGQSRDVYVAGAAGTDLTVETVDGSRRDNNDEDRYAAVDPSAKQQGELNGHCPEVEKHSAHAHEEDEEEAFPTWNGGECRDGLCSWSQSVHEVHVCVRVPRWVKAKDVRVEIRRLHVSVLRLSPRTRESKSHVVAHGAPGSSLNVRDTNQSRTITQATGRTNAGSGAGHESVAVILEGTLSRPVEVGECLWTIERPGQLLLYLQKELPAEGEAGFEWWARVFDGDAGIDVLTCDAGPHASEYPEHARRRGAKALWEHQRKSPEERKTDELNQARMREARQQMEEEVEQRQRDLERALKNPKKADMYRKLRKLLPDTTISLK